MSCYTGFFNVRRGWQSLNTGPRFYLRLIRRTGWLLIYTSRTTDGETWCLFYPRHTLWEGVKWIELFWLFFFNIEEVWDLVYNPLPPPDSCQKEIVAFILFLIGSKTAASVGGLLVFEDVIHPEDSAGQHLYGVLDTGVDPGGAPGARPPKIGKNMIFFGVKSWFFTRNTPKIFAPPSARRNFFKCALPYLEILDPPLRYLCVWLFDSV